jgi:hypothetical protein
MGRSQKVKTILEKVSKRKDDERKVSLFSMDPFPKMKGGKTTVIGALELRDTVFWGIALVGA